MYLFILLASYQLQPMKKFYFLILLFYCSSALYAQGNSPQKSSRPVSVFYGKKYLQQSSFGNQLNTLDHAGFNGPLSMAGFELGLKGYRVGIGNSHILWLTFGLTFILPAKVQVNDSVTAKLSGFHGGILLFGKSFKTKKQTAGLSARFGINAGYVKLKNGALLRVKNNYISPKLSLRPWILLKPLKLSLICEYEYDLSKKDWKPLRNSRKDQPPVNKLSFTGLSVFLCIGVNIM